MNGFKFLYAKERGICAPASDVSRRTDRAPLRYIPRAFINSVSEITRIGFPSSDLDGMTPHFIEIGPIFISPSQPAFGILHLTSAAFFAISARCSAVKASFRALPPID